MLFDTAYSNTRQLDYYERYKVNTDSKSKVVSKSYFGIKDLWWLRSAFAVSDGGFNCVDSNMTSWNGADANTNFGLAPAFRIG